MTALCSLRASHLAHHAQCVPSPLSVVTLLQSSRAEDDTEEVSAPQRRPQARHLRQPSRRNWSQRGHHSDAAAAWSKMLAPVYSLNIVGLRLAAHLMVRVLQLPSPDLDSFSVVKLCSAAWFYNGAMSWVGMLLATS